MMLRRPFAAAFLAALACTDSSGHANFTLKSASDLAAQLDTIDAGLASPQLKSFSAMALPMLAAGLTIHHMDSGVLGKTVEWNPLTRTVFLTTRAGTPGNVLQVPLYVLDTTGLPAPGKVEIGYAYLEPLNEYTGGRRDSSSLRFTLFKMSTVVADWIVWRLPADTACGQCASISATTNPTGPGGRFISLTIPYTIPLHGDGSFSGTSHGAGFEFVHSATLPGPTSTAATANWSFSWQGDSIAAVSGPLHPQAGELVGRADVTINGARVATVTRSGSGTVAVGADGRQIVDSTDAHVLDRLFAVPAAIADYIDWPTFVIFFCGC